MQLLKFWFFCLSLAYRTYNHNYMEVFHMKKITSTQIMRRITQFAMLLYVTFLSTTHMYQWPGTQAGFLDAYCPMGGLEILPTFIGTGRIVLHSSFNDIMLLGVLILVTLIFGSAFCGYLCPFGTIQEWLFKLRTLLVKANVTLKGKLATGLSYIRYLVLVALMIQTTVKGPDVTLPFTNLDPYRALFHFGREMTPLLWIILICVLAVSLVWERGFCSYLCPLGGFIGTVNLAAFTRITNDSKSCTNCGQCDQACPLGLTPSGKLEHTRCIMCGKCVDACELTGSLKVTFAGKAWA